MSPAVALELVTKRAQLMQALPPGSMLAVALSETNLRPMLNHTLAIAAVNGPRTCVVSGPSDAISAFDDLLRGRGVSSIGLRTSHAFHSAMMDPMLEDFGRLVRSVRLNAPQIAVLSNLSGSFAGTERITDPDYWVRQVRETVRFWDCVRLLCDKPNRILWRSGQDKGLVTPFVSPIVIKAIFPLPSLFSAAYEIVTAPRLAKPNKCYGPWEVFGSTVS